MELCGYCMYLNQVVDCNSLNAQGKEFNYENSSNSLIVGHKLTEQACLSSYQ